MNSTNNSASEEKSVRRWGGLAGMLGGIVFILVLTLLGFVPPAPSDPAGLVMRFPDGRAAITVGNGLDFGANILLLALFLALYRTLSSVVGGFFFGVTSVVATLVVVPIYVVLPILLGWKVYSLSKAAQDISLIHCRGSCAGLASDRPAFPDSLLRPLFFVELYAEVFYENRSKSYAGEKQRNMRLVWIEEGKKELCTGIIGFN